MYVIMEPSGRVMIPKAVRKRLKLDPGEELEVYSYGTMVGFKKKRPMFELIDIMEEAVNQITKDRTITKPKRDEICESFENLKKTIQRVAYRQ